MIYIEDSEKKECPVLQKEVEITNLYSVEPGGSCQMDIEAVERSCSQQEQCNCRTATMCLLYAPEQYLSREE